MKKNKRLKLIISTLIPLLLVGGFFILNTNSNDIEVLNDSPEAGASVLKGYQGGTGLGTATAGNVNQCLKVSDDDPFTYTLGTCGSGGGGGTSWELREGTTDLGNVTSVSFDPGGFIATVQGDGSGLVRLDYTNGPASRAAAQTISGLWNFTTNPTFSSARLVTSNSLDFDEFVSNPKLDSNFTFGASGAFDFNLNDVELLSDATIRLNIDGTVAKADGAITFGANDDGSIFFDNNNLIITTVGANGGGISLVPANALTIFTGAASVSTNFEATGYASASKYFGGGLKQMGGTDGCSAAGDTLNYTASTGIFSCGSDATGAGGSVSSNSLDWDEFVNSMTLDANTSIASAGFTFTWGSGTRVGIGTTAADSTKLLRLGNGNDGFNSTANGMGLDFFSDSGIFIRDSNNNVEAKYEIAGSVMGVGTITNHPVTLWSNNVERARLTGVGFFGIGGTPGTKFEVQGTSSASFGLFGGLQVNGFASVAYSRFGTGATGHSLNDHNDVLISDDFEVDGEVFGDGTGSNSFAGSLTITKSLTAGNAFYGASLSDCDNATTSKILWDASLGRFSCGSDQNSGGATNWNDIGDPSGNGAVAMAETIQTLDWDTGAVSALGEDYLTLTVVNDAAADVATQRLLVLQNSAGANGIENGLVIHNADTDDILTTALEITSEAGTITTAIDIDDAEIGTALSTGLNDLTGTNWFIHGATGGASLSGNFNWLGELKPDGILCSNGQILKKTAANDWDCAADAGGSVSSNSLDFDEFVASMSLDTNTSIASGSFTLNWGAATFNAVGKIFTKFIQATIAMILPARTGGLQSTDTTNGNIAVDTASHSLNFYSGGVERVIPSVICENTGWFEPLSGDDYPSIYFNAPVVVTDVVAIASSSNNAVTSFGFNLTHGRDLTNTVNLFAGNHNASSSTTSQHFSSYLQNTSITSDAWVSPRITSASAETQSINIAVCFRYSP